jgi:hypothetical protein
MRRFFLPFLFALLLVASPGPAVAEDGGWRWSDAEAMPGWIWDEPGYWEQDSKGRWFWCWDWYGNVSYEGQSGYQWGHSCGPDLPYWLQ